MSNEPRKSDYRNKEENPTTDLSRFGFVELEEAAKLLTAYVTYRDTKGLDFLGNSIQLFFNVNSGFVFLSDEDYNVAMINDETGKLEQFFSCPQCGNEGFNSDDNKKEGFPFIVNNGFCSEKCRKENE